MDDLQKRWQEIAELIPQPQTRENDNKIRFTDKDFTLFADCGLIQKVLVENLNDKNRCDSQDISEMKEILKNQSLASEIEFSTCSMNPLGGVLRKRGLTMWDKTNLRYYCPYEELTQTPDIKTAKEKTIKGKSKLAVICEGETYYISNDWYAASQRKFIFKFGL